MRRRSLTALLALLATMAAGAATAQADSRGGDRGLRIVLTNDDGFEAPGLVAIREALCADGHEVTVVGPAGDQSGAGTAIRGASGFGAPFGVTRRSAPCGRRSGELIGVEGPPAFTVVFALRSVFAGGRAPDLVVSGINPGANIGRVLVHSGTVGAAVAAAVNDVPGMAVNLDIDPGFPPADSLAAFPAAARYAAELVGRLDRTRRRSRPLLGEDELLNVTYPVAFGSDGRHDPRQVREPLITVVGKRNILGSATFAEEPAGSGRFRFSPTPCGGPGAPCPPEPRAGADTTAIDEEHISITPLSADWTGEPRDRRATARRLGLRIAR